MNNKIVLIVLCSFLQMNIVLCWGASFDQFVNHFKKCEWSDLDSLRKIKMNDLKGMPELSMDDANDIIWSINNSDNVFNLPHEEWDGSEMPAPHIRTKNNKYRSYMHGYLGIFVPAPELMLTDEYPGAKPTGESSKIYALGRVELNKKIVALVVGYKYVREISFGYSTDVYIMNKSTHQLISAFCLSGDNPITSITYSDLRISSYEFTENVAEDVTDHYIYKISSDGILTETLVEKNIENQFSTGVISDEDGYVNVRSEPNVKSEVLYTMPDKTKVLFHKIRGTEWAEILKVDNSDKIGGFVHMSRIK